MRTLTALSVLMMLTASCKTKEQADMVILAAKVYTADSQFSMHEAIAIKDGKVLEAGTKELINGKYHADSIINAEDKFVYPGFIDAHCHFSGYGLSSYRLDLVGTTSYEEVLVRKNLLKEYFVVWFIPNCMSLMLVCLIRLSATLPSL